jgi:hypothetical protein
MLALTGAGLAAAAARPLGARAADATTSPITFPFDYADREIRFTATVDGRGPLTFALDSGAGGNVVFAKAAQRVGLSGGRRMKVTGASGDVTALMAHVDRLAFGPLTLADQGVLVLDVPTAEAIGLDGIVGWELLRRFATTVDFDARTLTVWPGAPDDAQLGDAVPIVVSDRLARIGATVNGIDGVFDIDTGDNGGISLFRPFVRRTGLLASAPPRFVLPKGTGSDVGGENTTYGLVRGTSFRLGPLTLDAPLYRYVDATSGVFARTDLAGNLGCEVWERFVLTFDYARSRVLLRPGHNANAPFVFNRTGLIVNPTPQGLTVIAVVPGSPAAAAGAQVGDRLAAVGGRSVEGRDGASLLVGAFVQPVGTVLPVRLLRGGTPVDVTLTLADLI